MSRSPRKARACRPPASTRHSRSRRRKRLPAPRRKPPGPRLRTKANSWRKAITDPPAGGRDSAGRQPLALLCLWLRQYSDLLHDCRGVVVVEIARDFPVLDVDHADSRHRERFSGLEDADILSAENPFYRTVPVR